MKNRKKFFKWREVLSICLAVVSVVATLPIHLLTRAESQYCYDEVAVYDMIELSEEKEEAVISGDYENSLGTLLTTENVAIQFKFTKPTGLNWGLKQRFLNPEPNNYFSNQGYYIFYHCQGRSEICILEGAAEIDQSGAKYSSAPFTFTGEQIVEIGAVNVYTDATKTAKIGREIYVKVDGEKVVSYMDTTISDGDVGAYVTVPVVDGNFDVNSGKIKTAKEGSRIDEPTVYDMSELSEGKEEAVISGDYENSLGTLPTTENVAIQFKFTKPTGLNWGLKQRFLNPEPNNYFSNQGYYIFYHCQGRSEICILEGAAEIDQSGAKYSSAPFTFAGEQIVEIGAVNVYTDATKTTKIGREIYVKVDGEKVVSYMDTTISAGDVGTYVTVPVVDGNLDANSGKLQTMLTNDDNYDTAIVYDMSELSEGKEEEFIGANYENSLGTLPTTENVAIQFKFTKPTGLNWAVKQRFLNPEPNNYFSNQGYYIFYHCQGRSEICILEGAAEIDQSGAKYSSAPFTFTGEQIVEIGAVNVYTDATKTTKIGREIYVKVDGEKVVSYMDTTISAGDVGAYVTVPVVDGTFTPNSGKITALRANDDDHDEEQQSYTDTATVYDMSELSDEKIKAVISGDYEHSLGTLSTTENVAVKFKFTKPTGLNWGLKQRFLNPEPNNNYISGQGYYIFYHCQGRGEICILEGAAEIDQTGAKYSSVPFEFTGEQIVEIGAVNAYVDATKTTKVGREIYVKVDGEKVVSYLDTTISSGDLGSYVTVPVVDGTFNPNSGFISTTYKTIMITPEILTAGATGTGVVDTVEAIVGKPITIAVKPAKDSTVDRFTVDGKNCLKELKYDSESGKYLYTIANAKEDTAVKVSFKKVYWYGEATVYDMSDLSDSRIKATISENYDNSLGALPTTENVAVKFKLTKPTGLNWGLKHRFLNPEPNNNYISDQGYYIFYHCQGRGAICILEGAAEIDQAGAKYSLAPFEFTGEQIVEVGSVNIYSNATKTTVVGREIYVKVDGKVVVSYLDNTISSKDIGSYVTVPVVDGTFNPNSGFVSTTYKTIMITPEIITAGATGTGVADTIEAVVGKPITIGVKPSKDSTVDRFTVDGKNCLKELKYDSASGKYLYTIKSVSANPVVKIRFHKSYWFDNAKVYDITELSEGKIETSITEEYQASLGMLPSTENVAVKFKLTKPTGLNWNVKHRFLNLEPNSYHSGLGGYYIYYHYEGKQRICIEDNNEIYSAADYEFAMGDTKLIEVGAVNIYSDAKKTNKVGRLIYVKIDGEEVVYYVDTTISKSDAGKYISTPVVDGTFTENTGKVMTTYNVYNITVLSGKNVLVQERVVEGKDYVCKIPMKKGEIIRSIKMNGKNYGFQNIEQVSSHMFIPLKNIREDKTFKVEILTGQKLSVNIADTLGCEIELPEFVTVRDELCFDIRLPIGKILKDILNNGVSIKDYIVRAGAVTKVRIPVVYENVNLSLELEDKSYSVVIQSSENGTITANMLSVPANDKLVLTCKAEEGYVFDYVMINGQEVLLQPDGTYTIEQVREDIEVTYSVIKKSAIEKTGMEQIHILLISGIISGVIFVGVGVLVILSIKRKKER